MSEHDESSVELPPSSLSHKELRMLCLDNDLSISGKKSLLIERLLDAGISWDELGLESLDDVEEVLEEDELILEESEIMEEKAEIVEEKAEIVEEIFEAEILGESNVMTSTKISKERIEKNLIKTLSNPKTLFSIVIVGLLIGSLFWYVYSQPEPFTADKLRYGDSMSFSISNGNLSVSYTHLTLPTKRIV